MTTFHTNGRIISIPDTIISADSQVSSVQSNKNTIRSTYGSKITAKNQTVFVNESTTEEDPRNLINHISESQDLDTLQQPQQKNNNVTFSAFKTNRTKHETFPCTQDNADQRHPKHPCMVCYFGIWVHLDDLYPNKCGKHIIDIDNTCTFKEYIQLPCHSCNSLVGSRYLCYDCEICKERINGDGVYVCRNNCPEGYFCDPDRLTQANPSVCRKICEDNSNCDWFNCEECNYLGLCQSTCGTGDTCDAGICRSNCYPLCNPDNCETCEYKNGVYGCQGVGASFGGDFRTVCCKGKLYEIEPNNECIGWDQSTCTTILNACPPGTTCVAGTGKCKPICTNDTDCNPACCESCAASDRTAGVSQICQSCPDGGVCLDGECKQNDFHRSVAQQLNDIKKCNGCQRLSFRDIPGCQQGGECLKSECFECIDYCAQLSKASSKYSFKCEQMPSGKFECRAYELQILSINFTP